jgi:hypothetical protein
MASIHTASRAAFGAAGEIIIPLIIMLFKWLLARRRFAEHFLSARKGRTVDRLIFVAEV